MMVELEIHTTARILSHRSSHIAEILLDPAEDQVENDPAKNPT